MQSIAIYLSPLLLLVVLSEVILWRSGETIAVSAAAETMASPGFGPALYQRMVLSQETAAYRVVQVKKQQSEVLVLGSSRSQRFRSEMFSPSQSFYNASNTLAAVGDIRAFSSRWPQRYRPRVLLIGVDYWWFKDSQPFVSNTKWQVDGPWEERGLSLGARMHAYRGLAQRLLDGRLSRSTVFAVLRGARPSPRRIGLLAWESHGFATDGSVRVFDVETPMEYRDRERPPVVDRVKDGLIQFTPGRVRKSRLREFEGVLSRLASDGASIVLYLPPFSGEVWKALEERPSELDNWRTVHRSISAMADSHGWLVLDGSNPRSLGLDDRYLEDGFHGMETFHATLLLLESQKGEATSTVLGVDHKCLERALGSRNTTMWYVDVDICHGS